MDHFEAWQKFKNLTYQDLPDDVVKVANQCVLDWFGCAVAGSVEPLSEILRAEFGHRTGRCSLIGSDVKTDAATAALLNGASGHALDFDDTSNAIGCHATAPVLPAVLAAAEEMGASGSQMLTAFVVGVEIEGRVGNAFGPEHYAMGWHTTSTFGVFGAAAAVAYLMKLNDEQFGMAIGLAASQASGLKANFGTMTKPFHAGHAAECGLVSARLASRGYTANAEALAGKQGLIKAASHGDVRTERLEKMADSWLILDSLFKYHASCYLTHATIDGVLKLRGHLDVNDLSSLTLTVHPNLLDICGIEQPKTGLEGKFSLRGTASLALNGIDTSDPHTFVDEVINGEDVQGLMRKISIETSESLGYMQSKVVWVDQSQNAHEEFVDTGIPARDLEEQGIRLTQKFLGLCAIGGLDASSLQQHLSDLPGSERISLG